MIRSLAICYVVATSVALILPCVTADEQAQVDQSTKTPESTPTSTPTDATITPPPSSSSQSTELDESSVGQQLLSLPPPFPKQTSAAAPVPLPYDANGQPNLLAREIFLQPDPVAYIIRMVAALPSTTNLQEQVTLLNDVLNGQQGEQSNFNVYVQGLLLMLQNHAELRCFLRAVSEIKQSVQWELGITDASDDVDTSSAEGFAPSDYFSQAGDFKVFDDYYDTWQQDSGDETNALQQ